MSFKHYSGKWMIVGLLNSAVAALGVMACIDSKNVRGNFLSFKAELPHAANGIFSATPPCSSIGSLVYSLRLQAIQ